VIGLRWFLLHSRSHERKLSRDIGAKCISFATVGVGKNEKMACKYSETIVM
jgi:hypothetical protein